MENRKTSPCSPCAPNLLHVLVSRMLGYHNLCSPAGTHHYHQHQHLFTIATNQNKETRTQNDDEDDWLIGLDCCELMKLTPPAESGKWGTSSFFLQSLVITLHSRIKPNPAIAFDHPALHSRIKPKLTYLPKNQNKVFFIRDA